MGFRSYVRHFRGAILELLRPSEAWCFPAGRWFFPWCFSSWGPDVNVAKLHSSSKRKKEPKASFSIGFRRYVRHFRGVILGRLCPSEAWCFPIWRPAAAAAAALSLADDFFRACFLAESFHAESTEADKTAGTGRLLLLCMPFRSAAHAAIGLFVFALDSPKFYGALDAGSTSRACVRKVGCRQRRPKNSILHAKLFPTHVSVVDISGSNWSSNRFLAKRACVHIKLFWWWTLLYVFWDRILMCIFFFARHGLARMIMCACFLVCGDCFPCLLDNLSAAKSSPERL